MASYLFLLKYDLIITGIRIVFSYGTVVFQDPQHDFAGRIDKASFHEVAALHVSPFIRESDMGVCLSVRYRPGQRDDLDVFFFLKTVDGFGETDAVTEKTADPAQDHSRGIRAAFFQFPFQIIAVAQTKSFFYHPFILSLNEEKRHFDDRKKDRSVDRSYLMTLTLS